MEIIQRLWEIGVDFLQKNKRGLSPLACAVGMGREDVVDYLLQKGIRPDGIDTTKPIRPWKGAFASKEVFERIRMKIQNAKQQP